MIAKKPGLPAFLLLGLLAGSNLAWAKPDEGRTDNTPDWFYPAWAADAKYHQPIRVRDTESALGRYALEIKEIGLKVTHEAAIGSVDPKQLETLLARCGAIR